MRTLHQREHHLVAERRSGAFRLEVLEGPTGRRRWPDDVKARLVAETLVPGASVSVVARRHDVNANQVFKWRRELATADQAALPMTSCEFVPVGVFAEVA